MKRILMLLAVLLVVAAMTAITAAPAFAKGRPFCPGGSFIIIDGIQICLK